MQLGCKGWSGMHKMLIRTPQVELSCQQSPAQLNFSYLSRFRWTLTHFMFEKHSLQLNAVLLVRGRNWICGYTLRCEENLHKFKTPSRNLLDVPCTRCFLEPVCNNDTVHMPPQCLGIVRGWMQQTCSPGHLSDAPFQENLHKLLVDETACSNSIIVMMIPKEKNRKNNKS